MTQEEKDYYIKKSLRIPPEQRYQRKKAHWYWHESSWTWRGLDTTGYDGQGCNQFTGCIPECQFYPEYGRIEDEQVIETHKELVEFHRRNILPIGASGDGFPTNRGGDDRSSDRDSSGADRNRCHPSGKALAVRILEAISTPM